MTSAKWHSTAQEPRKLPRAPIQVTVSLGQTTLVNNRVLMRLAHTHTHTKKALSAMHTAIMENA